MNEEVRASIPEMPSKRRERYVSEFGLPNTMQWY